MSKKKVEQEEPGVIGSLYQDKKTKEIGKLISRDSKYKTLMFETREGATFLKTYATFKINMIPYEDKERIRATNGTVSTFAVDVALELKNFVEDFHNGDVILRYNPQTGKLNIKAGRFLITDIYPAIRDRQVKFIMKQPMFSQIDFSDMDKPAIKKQKLSNGDYAFTFFINYVDFSDFLTLLRVPIINTLTEQTKKED